MLNDSILIDDRMRQSLAATEIAVRERLDKLRSRLKTAEAQTDFDFLPFIGEAEKYVSALGATKDRHVIERDDPNLAMILDPKPLGRQASNVQAHLMTHATTLESRLRHDLMSDLWLVSEAFQLSESLQKKIAKQSRSTSEPPLRP